MLFFLDWKDTTKVIWQLCLMDRQYSFDKNVGHHKLKRIFILPNWCKTYVNVEWLNANGWSFLSGGVSMRRVCY